MKTKTIIFGCIIFVILIWLGIMFVLPRKGFSYPLLLTMFGLAFAFRSAARFYANRRIKTWSPDARASLRTELRVLESRSEVSALWVFFVATAAAIWIWIAVTYSLHGDVIYLAAIAFAAILAAMCFYLPWSRHRPRIILLLGFSLVLAAIGWFVVMARMATRGPNGEISFHDSNLAFLPAMTMLLPGLTMITFPLLAWWRRIGRLRLED